MIHAIFISLIILGIYVTTWPGMIFNKPAELIQKLIDLTIRKLFGLEVMVAHRTTLTICKPLFGCLICMSSVWTIVIWLIDDHSFMLIPMMLVVAGLNTIIVSIIKDIMPYECDEDS